MRVVRNSPELLTGNAAMDIIPFVPREYNNQRIADLYRWAGQLWGVRGVESRSGYLYVDKDGKIQDARGDEEITGMLENLNDINTNETLDMGCGTGPVGFYILKNNKDAKVDMIDVNNRALELTKKGLEKNKLNANMLENVY